MVEIKKIGVFLLIMFTLYNGYGQGLHFSQYFNSPLLINPANTGFNPDFDYRVGGNYRNQFANVQSL